MLTIGSIAPDFCLPDSNGRQVCLTDYRGQWVVLYFYPKDNTSGCTAEAIDFSGQIETFRKLGAAIIGISPDPVSSHLKFIQQHDLKITLLSDPEHQILKSYGVWQLKKMDGREYYGVARTTYLIDPHGRIVNLWQKVNVAGHAENVVCQLRSHI